MMDCLSTNRVSAGLNSVFCRIKSEYLGRSHDIKKENLVNHPEPFVLIDPDSGSD